MSAREGSDRPVRPAIAARPPTIRLACHQKPLRVRWLRSGGCIHGDLLETSLGALCQAMVTAGLPDAPLQVREGRDAVAFVLSFHATAALVARAAEPDRQPVPSKRSRA